MWGIFKIIRKISKILFENELFVIVDSKLFYLVEYVF